MPDQAPRYRSDNDDDALPMVPPAPLFVAIQTGDTDTVQALDLLRRVRLFAEDMRASGLDVTVDGSLSITVRASGPPSFLPDDDA